MQQGKALRLPGTGGVQGLGQAGALHIGEQPAAAQRVQTVRRGGGKVGQLQFRGSRVQCIHKGLHRRAQGLALSLGPAEPQPLCRGSERFIKAHLLPDDPVLKAVRQFHLLGHQCVTVGVGQQAALSRCTGKLPFCQPQHEHIIRRVQTHLARAGQHHGVQCLGDMPQVGRAQQQAEQVLVLGHGHALLAQQAGHLVQQLHHHVPLAGGFLRRRDAPCRADILHQPGLLFLGPQLLQAEINRPADLLRVAALHLSAQGVHGVHQLPAGVLGPGKILPVLVGQLVFTKALWVFGEFGPPGRRIGRPGVGIVFQRTHLLFRQRTQPGLGQHGKLLGHVRTPQQGQQGPHRRGRGTELRGRGLVAVQRDVRHAELIPHGRPVFCNVAADHGDLAAPHALPHQAADGGRRAPGFLFAAG